jgi:hypothetical protein
MASATAGAIPSFAARLADAPLQFGELEDHHRLEVGLAEFGHLERRSRRGRVGRREVGRRNRTSSFTRSTFARIGAGSRGR